MEKKGVGGHIHVWALHMMGRAIGLPLAIENKDFKAQIGNRERQIGGNRYNKALAESVHF